LHLLFCATHLRSVDGEQRAVEFIPDDLELRLSFPERPHGVEGVSRAFAARAVGVLLVDGSGDLPQELLAVLCSKRVRAASQYVDPSSGIERVRKGIVCGK
jgi:hypothetical protein